MIIIHELRAGETANISITVVACFLSLHTLCSIIQHTHAAAGLKRVNNF